MRSWMAKRYFAMSCSEHAPLFSFSSRCRRISSSRAAWIIPRMNMKRTYSQDLIRSVFEGVDEGASDCGEWSSASTRKK